MHKTHTNNLNRRVVYLAINSSFGPESADIFFGSATIQPVKNARQSIRLLSVQLAARNTYMASSAKTAQTAR